MRGTVATMRGPGELAIEEYDLPEPGPGALLLRVRRANVCGSELHIWHGHHPLKRQGVLGHEFVGEVMTLGEGVETDYAGAPISVGDRVVAPYYLTCRRCSACLQGEFPLCVQAYTYFAKPASEPPHFHGAFGTHYYVHPTQYFFRVPDSIDDRVAAGANCALSQVIYSLDRAGLRVGETIAIQGAGGLGLNAAAVATELGAQVVAIEGVAERLALARRFGADELVDLGELSSTEERAERVRELTEGRGADVVLEVTGAPAAFPEALHLVRTGGRVLSIGNANVGNEFAVSLSPGLITRKGASVLGVVRYAPWYLHRSLRFLERQASRYPFGDLSDRDFGLADVEQALDLAEKRSVARPAVVPTA